MSRFYRYIPHFFQKLMAIWRPSYFREVDDYLYSWIVDLIIRYVAGVVPTETNTLFVNPTPFDLKNFTLKNLKRV